MTTASTETLAKAHLRNKAHSHKVRKAATIITHLLPGRLVRIQLRINQMKSSINVKLKSDRGDVPGWVLVVLMTTGLITAIWTIAAPRLSAILTHSLDSMSNIR